MKDWKFFLKRGGILAVFLLCIAISPVFGANVSENDTIYADISPVVREMPAIAITPETADLAVGDTLQFTAVLTDASGVADPGAEFIWESSDELVGTVDASGLFTAVSEGTVTISAVSGNMSAAGTVNVTAEVSDEEEDVLVSSIEMIPADTDLSVGDIAVFSAVAYDESGVEVPGAEFSWESSDELIGTVSITGCFTAVAPGMVIVRASVGEISAESGVTVTAAEVPQSTPEPITSVIESIASSNGILIPAANDVYLKVANDAGAKFNAFGDNTYHVLWTGGGFNSLHISNGEGTVYGEVTCTEDQSGTFYVTTTGGRGYQDDIVLLIAVNGSVPDNFAMHVQAEGCVFEPNPIPHQEPDPSTVTYDPDTLDEWFTKEDLIYGPQIWRPAGSQYPLFPYQDMSDDSNTFRMMAIDLNTGVLTNQPAKITYEFKNLQTYAAVNAYGYAKNIISGGTTVYDVLSWANRLTGIPGEWSGLYITGHEQSPAVRVTISPSSVDVPVNGKSTLDAKAFDNLGEEIIGASFDWASSDTGIGSVNEDDIFIPVSTGETDVSATCGNATGSAHITVVSAVPLVLESVSVYPPELSLFEDEVSTWQFAAEGFNQFGDPYPEAVFAWVSSNTTVGTIDGTGLFTLLAPGQTTITAECDGISGSATVTIRERPDWSLAMSGVSDIPVNRTDFRDIAHEHPLSYMDNRDNLWSGTSLKTLIGLVDDDDPSAFNTTKAESGYIVTVRGSGESSSAQFESTELVAEGVDYIVANNLSGIEIPDYTVDGRMYWPLYLHSTSSSGDARVVEQVSSIELAFPVENVTSVSLTPAEAKVWSDSTLQFTAEAYNQTGALIEDVSFLWSSSNTDVGTVDANGLFTPVSDGETVVTASVSGLSAQTNVTVFPSDDDPRVWHVEKDGSGDFATITEAIAFSRNDDTVMVGDGEWSDGISISRHLNLTSRNGPSKTTLTSSPSITGYDTKVSGFTFASGTISLNGAYFCEISGNTFTGGYIAASGSDNVTVCDNYINQSKYGVYPKASSNFNIYNNTIRVIGTGIRLASSCTDCKIYDNSIEGSGSTGRGIEISQGSGHQILNNVISGEQFGLYLSMSSGTAQVSLMTGNTVSGQFYLRTATEYFP